MPKNQLLIKPCQVFVDLETTGLSQNKHEICEIGILKIQDGHVIEIFQSYVRPRMGMDPRAEEAHGLSLGFLSNFPFWSDLLPSVEKFLGSWSLFAYNAPFESRFLKANGINMNRPVMDLLKRAKAELGKDVINHKLRTVCEKYGFQTEFHSALNDCVAMWRLAKEWRIL